MFGAGARLILYYMHYLIMQCKGTKNILDMQIFLVKFLSILKLNKALR